MDNLILMIIDLWFRFKTEILSDGLVKFTVVIKKIFMFSELMADPDLVIVGTKEADKRIKRFITHGNASRYDKVCIYTLLSKWKLVEEYYDLLGVTSEETDAVKARDVVKLAKRLNMI